jgi:hypothetical protein
MENETNRNEELARLERAWRRLTWWQKKTIVVPLRFERLLDAMALEPWYWLQRHITSRRAHFAFWYPAHWL